MTWPFLAILTIALAIAAHDDDVEAWHAPFDATGGVKFRPTRRSRIDLGYVRVSYPGYDANRGYNYGDFNVTLDYDSGPVALNAKLRFSPDGFADSGRNWNKRLLVSVPLDFLKLADEARFKTCGSSAITRSSATSNSACPVPTTGTGSSASSPRPSGST